MGVSTVQESDLLTRQGVCIMFIYYLVLDYFSWYSYYKLCGSVEEVGSLAMRLYQKVQLSDGLVTLLHKLETHYHTDLFVLKNFSALLQADNR